MGNDARLSYVPNKVRIAVMSNCDGAWTCHAQALPVVNESVVQSYIPNRPVIPKLNLDMPYHTERSDAKVERALRATDFTADVHTSGKWLPIQLQNDVLSSSYTLRNTVGFGAV